MRFISSIERAIELHALLDQMLALRLDAVHIVIVHRKDIGCALVICTTVRAACACQAIEGIITIGMAHLTTCLATLWQRCCIGDGEDIAHGIIAVSVIHNRAGRRGYGKVLQSATLWVVGIERFHSVTILRVASLLELVVTNLLHVHRISLIKKPSLIGIVFMEPLDRISNFKGNG